MEFQRNATSTLLPTIGEASYERLPPPRNTRREVPKLRPQPIVTIIRLQPCNHSHSGNPTPGSAKPGVRNQKRSAHPPVPPFQKRPVGTQAPSKKLVPIPHKPAHTPLKPILTSAKRPPLPTPYKPSTRPTPSKHASNPGKHVTYARRRELPSMPSTSSIASSITDQADKRKPGTRGTPPNSRCPTPQIIQKRQMSERAAETVRIMEWAKAQVKAAEKRARDHERAACKEREFMMRLRQWEAEMKVRRMVENSEGEMADEEVHPEDECSDRGISWLGEQSQMGRFRTFVRERRKRCLRGLATVLRR